MEQSPSYITKREKICKFPKAIYLKKALEPSFNNVLIIVFLLDLFVANQIILFLYTTPVSKFVAAFYGNNILLTSSDAEGIIQTKQHLQAHLLGKILRNYKTLPLKWPSKVKVCICYKVCVIFT